MDKDLKDATLIVTVALIGGYASKYFNSALDTPELGSIIRLAIITILLLIVVSILLYAIRRGKEIEEATTIVAGVLIGVFISKYFEITSNESLLVKTGLLAFVFAYLLLIVYYILKCINPEWLSNIQRRISKILNYIFT